MKKIYYYLLLVLPLLTLQSCLHQEEDLFDKSPSERMQEAITEYSNLLKANADGWVFEYYPEPTQSLGGYNYIVKFDGSQVTTYFELAGSQDSETSLYQIIPRSGPVLTFDTYNFFMHFFAEPSVDLYQGYQGDYEFIIMGTSADESEVYLKGTRTGNKMTLRKLPSGETASSYIEKIEQTINKTAAAKYLMHMNGTDIECTMTNRNITYNDADGTQSLPFCYTSDGIRLYKPLVVGNDSIYSFKAEEAELVSTTGNVTIEYVYMPLNSVFVEGLTTLATNFVLDFDVQTGEYDCSDAVAQMLYDAAVGNINYLGELLTGFRFGNYEGSPVFRFYSFDGSTTWSAIWKCSVSLVQGTEDQITFGGTLEDSLNASYYPAFKAMAQLIIAEGTYIITADNMKTPTRMTLTSVRNPDIWFNVSLQ
jgi:hypothetical protein